MSSNPSASAEGLSFRIRRYKNSLALGRRPAESVNEQSDQILFSPFSHEQPSHNSRCANSQEKSNSSTSRNSKPSTFSRSFNRGSQGSLHYCSSISPERRIPANLRRSRKGGRTSRYTMFDRSIKSSGMDLGREDCQWRFPTTREHDSMVVSVPFLEPSRIPVQGQKTVLL
jgi:hypothetical protein